MEVLTAIALLCQLNVGVGGGRWIDTKDNRTLQNEIFLRQKTCQKKLASCISNGTGNYTRTAMKCIRDR